MSVSFVLEKIGGILEWNLLCGPNDPEQARIYAPDSLRAKLGTSTLRNAIYASESQAAYARDVKAFFPAAFPLERTCAIIKPDAIQHTDAIMEVIKNNGFTIIAK